MEAARPFGHPPLRVLRGMRLLACLTTGLIACASTPTQSNPEGMNDAGSTCQPSLDPMDVATQVSREKYLSDLVFIASAPRGNPDAPHFFGEHSPDSQAHWQEIQDFCYNRLLDLGFSVERQEDGRFVNVIGIRPGGSKASELIVLGAHYDTLPHCPGANDNGSGVAGVLELARLFSTGTFARTLVIACWDQEEFMFLGARPGSEGWVDRELSRKGTRITLALNLDVIGYKSDLEGSEPLWEGFDESFPTEAASIHAGGDRGDFLGIEFNPPADPFTTEIAAYASGLGLPVVALRAGDPKARPLSPGWLPPGGDHLAFWDRDIPAMLFWNMYRDTNVHCLSEEYQDVVGNLDIDFATSAVGLAGAIATSFLDPEGLPSCGR